jgi:hypothetical protein
MASPGHGGARMFFFVTDPPRGRAPPEAAASHRNAMKDDNMALTSSLFESGARISL